MYGFNGSVCCIGLVIFAFLRYKLFSKGLARSAWPGFVLCYQEERLSTVYDLESSIKKQRERSPPFVDSPYSQQGFPNPGTQALHCDQCGATLPPVSA